MESGDSFGTMPPKMAGAPLPRGILTGLARVPKWLLDFGETHGLDRRQLAQVAGLDEEELDEPDARVPVAVIWELWRSIIEAVPDPDLGLRIGEKVDLTQLGVVGYSLKYSGTLRRALQRMARYSRIVSQTVQMAVDDRPGKVEVTFARDAPFDVLRHPIDARLSSLVTMLRSLRQGQLNPAEVCFPYPRPTSTLEYERVFRSPLRFGAPAARLALQPADLDRPVTTGDEELNRYLDQYAENVLRELARTDSLSKEVLRTLWQQLSGGRLDLSSTARHLGLSARTLQRRLHDESTSFGVLLDSFRREASVRLLRDRGLAVEEVAFMLGYSEPSTFYRAFRRWTGLTPRRYRLTA
jgi:AraC-like DNA-binding protein